MKKCPQTDTQSVYQHGISVRDHMFQLIDMLKSSQFSKEWKVPSWIIQYRQQLLNSLMPLDIINEYTTYHDCGKPYCLSYDEDKRHFPNHAEVSYKTWLRVNGNPEAALLMKMDMDIHCLKDNGVKDFCTRPQAVTLLLAGLSEIHANAAMFGGIESSSFKIKYRQIDRRGNAICKMLYGE